MNERVERLTLSVPEAAEALGVSQKKVYDLVHTAGFPVLRLGRRVRISADGLRRWVDAQTEREGVSL